MLVAAAAVLVYAVIGVAAGRWVYVTARSPLPDAWFQGQTKARIVFFSVAVGVMWPGVLEALVLYRIPFFARWMTAFVRWEKPAPRASRPAE